jgi:hypothetical protein
VVEGIPPADGGVFNMGRSRDEALEKIKRQVIEKGKSATIVDLEDGGVSITIHLT